MIPPPVALIAWVFISISLFAMMSPVRAFLLTYVIGILFLPVEMQHGDVYHGAVVFTQSLRLEKYSACNLGAVLGTLLFAPRIFARYRFHWLDLAFLIVLIGEFLTSVVNDLGAKDGLSTAFDCLRDFLPLIILARLHLTTVKDVYEAMRAIIGGAFVYSAICVIEWRLSPQLHRDVYGYFQHDFVQFMRDDHFRPAGFLRHAIEVSSFMGSSTALTLWLWYKKLFKKPLWGLVPVWVVAGAIGIGLLSTMTVSGIGEMLAALGLLGGLVWLRSRWVLVILPVVCIFWMAGRYTNVLGNDLVVDAARVFVSPARAASLQYRLESEQLNLTGIGEHLMLGKGSQSAFVVKDNGRGDAMDAWWLLQIDFFGLTGIVAWYVIWSACIYETVVRWKRLTPDMRTLAAVICIMLGVQFVDFLFNSFPSDFLLILSLGMISVMQHYRPPRRQAKGIAVQQPMDAAAPAGLPRELVMP